MKPSFKSFVDTLKASSPICAFKARSLSFWRQRASELQKSLKFKHSETEGWRQLAQETMEKLWDLGQSLKTEEFLEEPITALKLEIKSP